MREKLRRLGAAVREAREAKGWNQSELAAKSGVGKGYVSNIETGYVNPDRGPVTPSDEVLAQLAQALEMPVAELHRALGRINGDSDKAYYRSRYIRRAAYDNGLTALTPEEERAIEEETERILNYELSKMRGN